MIPCTIIGDSIAVGLGQEMHECRTIAQVGISSGHWDQEHANLHFTRHVPVVISLGSNDGENLSYTLEHLERIRSRIAADAPVLWIVPACSAAAKAAVYRVSAKYHDRIIWVHPGGDGIHPRSYHELAASVRGHL